MDEAKRVEYYDAHRDEPEELTEVTATPANRKRESLSVTVAVRFSASEAEALSRTARQEHKTFSEIIRTAVQRYAQPELLPRSVGTITLSGYRADTPMTQPLAPPPPVKFSGERSGATTLTSGAPIAAR